MFNIFFVDIDINVVVIYRSNIDHRIGLFVLLSLRGGVRRVFIGGLIDGENYRRIVKIMIASYYVLVR